MAGGIDTVGSTTLANVLSMTRYGGVIAACGLAGRLDLPATVAPFILRGVCSSVSIPDVPPGTTAGGLEAVGIRYRCGQARHDDQRNRSGGGQDAGRRIVEGAVRGRIVVKIAE